MEKREIIKKGDFITIKKIKSNRERMLIAKYNNDKYKMLNEVIKNKEKGEVVELTKDFELAKILINNNYFIIETKYLTATYNPNYSLF